VNNGYPKEKKDVNKVYFDIKTGDGYSTNFKRVFIWRKKPIFWELKVGLMNNLIMSELKI
jgi:hypothetical protein